MKVLKLLLYPLAGLFNLGTRIRNHLYDTGRRPSVEFTTAVIAVGNLNVGGSGKTPMVEYLVRLLKNSFRVTTLSRGYRRQTKGYRKASPTDSALSIGDEPFQLLRKFGGEIDVIVGEDRALAIPQLLRDCPDTQVIVMDDALQHRSVKPRLSILVTDYARPFYRDFVLPFGRLRESRSGAKRADVIVVTKCDVTASSAARDRIRQDIARYAGKAPVFFSRIVYDRPLPFRGEGSPGKQIVLVTGIAKAESLQIFCKDSFEVVKHFRYPDHHRYNTDNLREIENYAKSVPGGASILTTEKDMVKLLDPALQAAMGEISWFYVPIRHQFLEDGLKFDDIIVRALRAGST